MTWHDLIVSGGDFARAIAPDDRISGQFFGPEAQEVAGIFERDGIAGAFGGIRE